MASVRLCTRTRAVHRPRMELFVGYSRRVEDEWFWREKRESFSTLPATRDRGIFNGVTWYLSWLDLCLRRLLVEFRFQSPPFFFSFFFFNSLGSFNFFGKEEEKKERRNIRNIKYLKRMEMLINVSRYNEMRVGSRIFSTFVITWNERHQWNMADRNISFYRFE